MHFLLLEVKINNFQNLLSCGFSVFPLSYGSKRPNISWQQYQENHATIERCIKWDSQQNNIAIVTGKISDIFVLDIDGEDGDKRIRALMQRYNKLPRTLSARTGNGIHLYFRYPDNRIIKTQAGIVIDRMREPNIDIRGDGGYVVAPPSIQPNGTSYRWVYPINDIEIAHAPKWLLDIISEKPASMQKKLAEALPQAQFDNIIQKEILNLQYAAKGTRNHQLNKSAFALGQHISNGLDEKYAREILTKTALEIGLEQKEITSTIHSGFEGGKKNPYIHNDNWNNPDLSVVQKQKPNLPKCPYDLLGDTLAKFIKDASLCKCAPPDYIFAALLSATAGIIGNSRRIEVWHKWQEPTALWFMLVGLPSCNKSPALDAVFPFIHRIEADYQKQYETELKAYNQQQEMQKAVNQQWQIDEQEILPKPKVKRLLVNDSTVEKTALILADNPRGLIYSRDELAGLLANL